MTLLNFPILQCLHCLTETFGPTLWVGTTQGVVGVVSLKVSADLRTEIPVSASIAGMQNIFN